MRSIVAFCLSFLFNDVVVIVAELPKLLEGHVAIFPALFGVADKLAVPHAHGVDLSALSRIVFMAKAALTGDRRVPASIGATTRAFFLWPVRFSYLEKPIA